jgi:hypothetical protein
MKKKEELFYLIKSLTKAEKRYFKVHSVHEGNSEYLLLFNAIDSQEVYNEDKIRNKFQNKRFIKQLTSLKNYLKNKILSSLRNFHSKISVRAEISDILRNVEILFNKGLYKICESELMRAEKKASQFQINNLSIEIFDWKRKIHQSLFPQDWKSIEKMAEFQKSLLKTSSEYIELVLANVNPNKFTISHKPSSNIHNLTLSKLHQFQIHLRQSRLEEAKSKITELLGIWEKKKELVKEYLPTYFSISNTYIAFLVHEKDFDRSLAEIEKLKTFKNKLNSTSALLQKEILRMYNIELEIYRDLKDLSSGIRIIPEIQKYLEKNQKIVPSNYLLSFQFQFAIIYFLGNDLKSSINCVNEILNTKEKHHRSDLITFTYWLNLLIHFEWGNSFVLRYFVDSMRRHLSKLNKLDSYEKILLKFLAKNVGIISRRELNFKFDTLRSDLSESGIPKNTLDYIDFYSWIDQKRN